MFIDFRDPEAADLARLIRRRLARRGLKPDFSEEWEVHGPHSPEMPYQVYIGRAFSEPVPGAKCICPKGLRRVSCPAHRQDFWVAIYPRGVYQIDSPEDWWKVTPDQKIPVLKASKKG
jgi:hypothetical protein